MSARYGCHGRPRPTAETTYVAQYGWEYSGITRSPLTMDVYHVMSTTCQYDKATTDAKCVGCEHINPAVAAGARP